MIAPTVIVHHIDTDLTDGTWGPFLNYEDALAWIDGRRKDGAKGSFRIDRLCNPSTWVSKLSEFTVTWHPQIAGLADQVKETVVEAASRDAAITAVANDYPAPIIVVKVRP